MKLEEELQWMTQAAFYQPLRWTGDGQSFHVVPMAESSLAGCCGLILSMMSLTVLRHMERMLWERDQEHLSSNL